jgi:hypothetical protein
MVSIPLEKALKQLFSEKLLILVLIILVAIIAFSFYRYFYATKENFEEALPLSEEAIQLLKDSKDLGIDIPASTKSQLPRILGLEGLCSGFDQPFTLTSISNPAMKEGEGCGWYYFEDPEAISFSAFGNGSGPLNPVVAKRATGGKWYFGNMKVAQEKEDKKLCKRINTCQLADLYGPRCGWCNTLGHGIPIDGNASKFMNEDEWNCLSTPIKEVKKCPVIKSSGPVKPAICDSVNGLLTKECLIFLADSVGIDKSSPIYSILNGDPDGYLVPDTQANRKFKIAFGVMSFKAGIPYNKEVMETKEAKRESALKYFQDLKYQTTRGSNERIRQIANYLVQKGNFTTDVLNPNSKGPFLTEQLQSEFVNLGVNESGSMYPNKKNMDAWEGMALKDIRAKVAKICLQDINSIDPAIQNAALNKCFGMKIPDKTSDFLPCAKGGVALRAGKTPEELAKEALNAKQAAAAAAASEEAKKAAQKAKEAVDEASASAASTDLGCWKDANDRHLKGSNQGRPHTKDSCGAKAKALGHKFFSVQDGNECYTGNEDYKRHGKAEGDCPPGGGGWKAHTWQIGNK